jgi:hypothetical protein
MLVASHNCLKYSEFIPKTEQSVNSGVCLSVSCVNICFYTAVLYKQKSLTPISSPVSWLHLVPYNFANTMSQ